MSFSSSLYRHCVAQEEGEETMNAIVRVTADELEAEGAVLFKSMTELDYHRIVAEKIAACKRIAKRIAKRLGGKCATNIKDVTEKQNTTFLMAEAQEIYARRTAAKEHLLFTWVFQQARKNNNNFIFVVPEGVGIDWRVKHFSQEFKSLKEFEEWLVGSDGVKFLLDCAKVPSKPL